MLDINWLSENLEEAQKLLRLKGYDKDLGPLLSLNEERKALQFKIDESRKFQKEIASQFKKSLEKASDKAHLRERGKEEKARELTLLAEHENIVFQIKRKICQGESFQVGRSVYHRFG